MLGVFVLFDLRGPSVASQQGRSSMPPVQAGIGRHRTDKGVYPIRWIKETEGDK